MANLSYEDRKAIERYLNENGYLPSDNDELEEIFNIERDDNGNIEKVISIYDFQVPSQSIEVGEAIKVSDLTQELGYTTKYDNRQYILMNYEITDNGNINPTVKDFSEPSSFELQGLYDVQESYTNSVSFPLVAVQNVIGKIYNLKASTTSDLRIKLYRNAANIESENALIVDETIPANQTNINGFDFELKPLTDFVSGASYILDLSVESGNIDIKGTLINGTDFFPYIKRIYGWQYEKKELAFKEEVPSNNGGNAIAQFYHYSFNTGQDNFDFFDDGVISVGWDSPGSDVELKMITQPQGTGDLVSYAKTGSSSVVSTYITQPNIKYDIFPAGVPALEVLVVSISAEQDPNYPSYILKFHNAGSSFNTVVEIKKVTNKN